MAAASVLRDESAPLRQALPLTTAPEKRGWFDYFFMLNSMKQNEDSVDGCATASVATACMEWSDLYLLGYGPMDGVHEEFVDILGRMQRTPDAGLPTLLDELHRHVSAHFEFENKCMEETDFPPRQCHIDEHDAVMKSVSEVRIALAAGKVEACRRLVDALADWFPSHADHLDSALAHWMTKRAFGGKPVVLRRGLTLR